ncbi:hypothetical protein ABZ816_23930 [Actinosynnema sp. NPDC047251]|uniref:Uncharacterized protein n=1 Tax=Saccharothrix espanaensis (strain ATCC 51144 / DSM 44229 / JCM 9112 / NBRC 15066 / NRRL 15764) TaxID=1179773 RepID=K0K798_SACES|nr:hypothetical protein [Saccharothrix espanaensis]CCH32478.1 hypothetical protein BN6_52130 [Saccharothrix espanaensis DSM 44229]
MTGPELRALDLVGELTSAGAERRHALTCGDAATAGLLAAWIDALLDEWNRRVRAG